MSLSQRLHKPNEKAGSLEQSAQEYEATIRRLKLLSKSQTALLKVRFVWSHYIAALSTFNMCIYFDHYVGLPSREVG